MWLTESNRRFFYINCIKCKFLVALTILGLTVIIDSLNCGNFKFMDNDVNGKVNEYRQHCQVQLNWLIKHLRKCFGPDITMIIKRKDVLIFQYMQLLLPS